MKPWSPVSKSSPFAIVVAFQTPARDRFVLARHAERGWEIPGGHIEADETPREAAVREFHEEIGRGLTDLQLLLVQDREVGRCHVFTGIVNESSTVETGRDDKIEDWRFVEALGDVQPLAFPNDPYEAIEDELGVKLR